MKTEIAKRAEKLRELMKKDGADAFVIIVEEKTNWESLYYMSGFKGTAGAFVLFQDSAELLLDGRYIKQGGEQAPYAVTEQKNSLITDVKESLAKHSVKSVYCEASKTFHSSWASLAEYGAEWRDGSELLCALRRRKDQSELDFIRKASDLAAAAFLDSLNHVKAGMTELEYQALLNYKINTLGGETMPSLIVASGTRSAMPHGRATDKPMRDGEWVTVDFSAICGGYFCDITRNFSIGEPDQKALEYHDSLYEAHTEAVKTLRPGAAGTDAHNRAKSVLEDAGIAQYFTHGLGHGLGLEIHEAPTLSPKKADVLAVGDVVTVEPGVYLDGWGGLRLEDDYAITETGCERLTDKLDQFFYRI